MGNRLGVAHGGSLGTVVAKLLLDRCVVVVERVREVATSAARLTTARCALRP